MCILANLHSIYIYLLIGGRGGRSSRYRNDPVDTGSPRLDPQEGESEEERVSALSSAVPSPTTSQG